MTGFEWQIFRRGKTGLNGGVVCSRGFRTRSPAIAKSRIPQAFKKRQDRAGIPVAYLTAQMALELAGFQAGKTVLAPAM
jgi:hypothetical protein